MVGGMRILFAFYLLPLIVLAANLSENINIHQLSLEAWKANKYLFLFFHKEGCGYCERMLDESLKNRDIKSKLTKDFIFIKVDIDEQGVVEYRDFNGTKHAFAKSLKIGLYPSLIFMDQNNTIVYGVVGYRKVEEFSKILDYVSSGNYKTIDFESFESILEFEEDD
ncbi:MAG TPA: hypothetical protein CFH81_06530 [Sulfurovum sp. UBA12169]|nr:MAG TPA: hypothetical protein CFH81_06530 [Sulfurovum sp. UBA12169]